MCRSWVPSQPYSESVRRKPRRRQLRIDSCSLGSLACLIGAGLGHHATSQFDRLASLAEALTRVQALCRKRKQEAHLELFEARYLADADLTPSWGELDARYGMEQKTARD